MTTLSPSSAAGWRPRLASLVESPGFQHAILALIVLNAVTLGLETSPAAMAAFGPALTALDRAVLAVFAVELALRIAAHGGRFFARGWNLFDLAVVAIALAPATGPLAVLRALRVLRVFRVVSAVPQMRSVVDALLRSVPGLGAIIALLGVVFYVFAVMATKLFGATNPELFGTLGASLYALFQVMTLEGWSGDIVNPVLAHHPYALAFFVPFMLLSTFTVLNLFIALIVDSMQKLHAGEADAAAAAEARDRRRLEARIAALADEVRGLRAAIERGRAGP